MEYIIKMNEIIRRNHPRKSYREIKTIVKAAYLNKPNLVTIQILHG